MNKKFNTICASNPTNALRGNDKHGNGGYGANRDTGRKHEGILNDIIKASVQDMVSRQQNANGFLYLNGFKS